MKHFASLVIDDSYWKDGFGDAIDVTKYQVVVGRPCVWKP
jgi:hypothetical protein